MTRQLTTAPGPTPTARDFIRQKSPPWLAHGWAERLLYALATQVDAFGDALTAALKMRFPNHYSADSLPALGRERRITRGLTETDASYADRLRRWLDDHRIRGGPYALLRQLYAYYSPFTFACDLIYRNGKHFHMEPDGTITTSHATWLPDTNPARWARWWLYLYTDAYLPPLSPQQIASLRLVPSEWNAAHCIGTVVLLNVTGEQWNFPFDHVWNEPGQWNTPTTITTLSIEG